MAHYFQITKGQSGQFTARFAYNAETLLWSETYASKASAKNCIESLKKNAPGAAVADLASGEAGKGYRFEIVESKSGEPFVRFVAANGETMMRSETYKAKASAKSLIDSVKKNAPGAELSEDA